MSVKVVDSELRTESGVAAEEHTALVGLDKFQRMNPTVFGAIEVAIGIFMVLTAIVFLAFDAHFVVVAAIYWGIIIIYIPAGAMVIATGKKLTRAMVGGTLALNVLVALSAVAGCFLHFFLIVFSSSLRMRNTEIVMFVLSIVLFIDAIVVVGFAVAALCSSKKEVTYVKLEETKSNFQRGPRCGNNPSSFVKEIGNTNNGEPTENSQRTTREPPENHQRTTREPVSQAYKNHSTVTQ